MSLLDEIRTYAEGAAATASRTLMRRTGWEVPGGAGVGLSPVAREKPRTPGNALVFWDLQVSAFARSLSAAGETLAKSQPC
jgi:hypothetical protein